VRMFKPDPGILGPLLRLSSKGVLEAEFDTSGALMNIDAVGPNGGVHQSLGLRSHWQCSHKEERQPQQARS